MSGGRGRIAPPPLLPWADEGLPPTQTPTPRLTASHGRPPLLEALLFWTETPTPRRLRRRWDGEKVLLRGRPAYHVVLTSQPADTSRSPSPPAYELRRVRPGARPPSPWSPPPRFPPSTRVSAPDPAPRATTLTSPRSPVPARSWPNPPTRSTQTRVSTPPLPQWTDPPRAVAPASRPWERTLSTAHPPHPRSSLAHLVSRPPSGRRSPLHTAAIHSHSPRRPQVPPRSLARSPARSTPSRPFAIPRRALPGALRRRLSPRAPTLWLLVSDPADAARALQIPRIRAWAARNASPMARRRALEEAAARTPPEQSPEPRVRSTSPPPRPGSRPVPPERHSRAWARAGEMTHLLSSEVEPPPVQAGAPPARAPSPAGRPPVSRAASLPPLGRGAAPPPPTREALVAALAHDPFAPQPPPPTSAPRPRSPGNTGPRLPGQGSAPAPRHTNAATVGSPPRPSLISDSHYPLPVSDPVNPATSPPPPARPAPSSPVERVAKLSGRELLELLRELRAESPELSALLGEVRDALDDLRALEDLRRIP